MWKIVTEADLAATISQREIDVFRRDAQPGASDPVEALLERTAARVRIYVASNRAVTMGEYPSVPASLVSTVCDLAAYDILKRFPVDVGADRKAARDAAEGLLKEIASGRIVPESSGSGSSSVAATPSSTHPAPIRLLD